MTTAVLAPCLQDSVNRYARALIVPSRLLALHPRKAGGAGNAAALAPAIVLGVISAFEGFVEDFSATAFHLQGRSFGQIVKKVNFSNPDVEQFEALVKKEFPILAPMIGDDFSVDVWDPPEVGTRLWEPARVGWPQARHTAGGWMQVRHCLAHGLASGWQSEVWPGPVKANATPASAVLKPMKDGKHSLVLHGAITCARVYRAAAEHLGRLIAAQVGETTSWSKLPDFPMYKTSLEEYLAANPPRGNEDNPGVLTSE
ncbi:hypothetical protein NONI108955_29990 [Nocardia ninae]|uniref:Uncharacterized protein n=1 Tax=Nocardia ninae NBRC 108245 TaxID=1210091 RepID=A0A511MGL0_9NOCA|nr:hypothetical protein [Nocardia ninae]GEM39719.1 hypothetical protein NN4_42380 [Nocardia ninae NBRC 108245]